MGDVGSVWSKLSGGIGFEFRSGDRSGITRPPLVLFLRTSGSGLSWGIGVCVFCGWLSIAAGGGRSFAG